MIDSVLTDRRFDRWLFAVLWLLLLTYALLFAPAVPADLLGQLRDLALARVQAVDPIAIAVFNLLGVLPVAFLASVGGARLDRIGVPGWLRAAVALTGAASGYTGAGIDVSQCTFCTAHADAEADLACCWRPRLMPLLRAARPPETLQACA